MRETGHVPTEKPVKPKLFYTFLYEKGYPDNPDKITEEIGIIEPHSIEVLRKQFT